VPKVGIELHSSPVNAGNYRNHADYELVRHQYDPVRRTECAHCAQPVLVLPTPHQPHLGIPIHQLGPLPQTDRRIRRFSINVALSSRSMSPAATPITSEKASFPAGVRIRSVGNRPREDHHCRRGEDRGGDRTPAVGPGLLPVPPGTSLQSGPSCTIWRWTATRDPVLRSWPRAPGRSRAP